MYAFFYYPLSSRFLKST